MEKILMAFMVETLAKEALSFGIYLSRLTHFGHPQAYSLKINHAAEQPILKNMYDGTYLGWEVDENSKEWQEKMQRMTQSVEQFQAFYSNHDIPTSVHRDIAGGTVKELIAEALRFADLLVLDVETSFKKEFEKLPTGFVEDMSLAQSECPVVIAPGQFDGIDEIVFAWDGSQSATFSIKLFTYLFPAVK